MISGRSDSIRLTTGFGGFMPSHSLVPVTAPRLGRDSGRAWLVSTHYNFYVAS